MIRTDQIPSNTIPFPLAVALGGLFLSLTPSLTDTLNSCQLRRTAVDHLSLKCHLISVVKTFDEVEIGTNLDTRLVAGSSLEGNLQFCNPAFERLAGQTMGEMINTSYRIRTHLDHHGQIEKQLALTIETGVSCFTDIFQSADGSLHRVRWKTELISPGDAFILCSGTVLDYNIKNNIICFPATPDAK